MLIALLGGGQLARMLALAGIPMGLRFRVLDPVADPCAGTVAEHVRGEFSDPAALDALVEGAAVLGFDFENVPAAALEHCAGRLPVHPGPAILAMTQDRLTEKAAFAELGVAVAPHAPVHDIGQVKAALARFGSGLIVKTRRFGYDGKGQVRVTSAEQAGQVFASIGTVPAIAEALVPFRRELSLVAVRGIDGELRCWPLVENVHVDGILALTLAPARVEPELVAQAEQAARAVAARYDYVGTFALEFFEVDGRLVLNEMAPRVHNSGHWSIEGAATCQFENHLRAMLGWPLGATTAHGSAAMLNLLGQLPPSAAALALPGVHWHDYGKKPRSGRKLGHVTLTAPDPGTLRARLPALVEALGLQRWQARLAPALERL